MNHYPSQRYARQQKAPFDIICRATIGLEEKEPFSYRRQSLKPSKAIRDCLYLYALLQFSHGSRAEPFAIASRNMAQAGIIPGWGHKRYEEATKRLIGVEKLVRVRNGGGRGNPNLYVFADKLPLGGGII